MDKYAAKLAKYERFLRECMESAKPDIIIWGPGTGNKPGYGKRKCVRKAILHEVPNGIVDFPEDRKLQKLTLEALRPYSRGNIDDIELLQALNADIVIALDISDAVGEEIARHSTNPEIASKLFVVSTFEHKSGYQKAIRNKGFMHVLKAAEMDSCDKPTKLCIDHVRSWCIQKCFKKVAR